MDKLKEAMHYERLEDQNVICRLCPHGCKIALGKYGICRVRSNIEGTLYTHNYGKVSALATIDLCLST